MELSNMRIRNKEHQTLGLKELQQLCDEFPNDLMLGEELRRITKAAASVNNPKGRRATSLIYEDNPSEIDKEYE